MIFYDDIKFYQQTKKNKYLPNDDLLVLVLDCCFAEEKQIAGEDYIVVTALDSNIERCLLGEDIKNEYSIDVKGVLRVRDKEIKTTLEKAAVIPMAPITFYFKVN